jgi:hypothetical protein
LNYSSIGRNNASYLWSICIYAQIFITYVPLDSIIHISSLKSIKYVLLFFFIQKLLRNFYLLLLYPKMHLFFTNYSPKQSLYYFLIILEHITFNWIYTLQRMSHYFWYCTSNLNCLHFNSIKHCHHFVQSILSCIWPCVSHPFVFISLCISMLTSPGAPLLCILVQVCQRYTSSPSA